MVNPPEASTTSTESPFALRATLFTAGFLLLILGVVPSLFHLVGEWLSDEWVGFGAEARAFWQSLRVLTGMAVFAAGFVAYLACSAWLIFHGRGPHVEFDPPKVFVANGPYRWVRNPVVITLLVTVLGEAIFLGSWGIFALVALGLPLAHYQVTRVEEPRLEKRFGESYVDYCRRVPRWMPRPPRD